MHSNIYSLLTMWTHGDDDGEDDLSAGIFLHKARPEDCIDSRIILYKELTCSFLAKYNTNHAVS